MAAKDLVVVDLVIRDGFQVLGALGALAVGAQHEVRLLDHRPG